MEDTNKWYKQTIFYDMAKKGENVYSFKKGFGLIANKDVRKAKEEIMKALGITARSQWYQRLYGNIIPNVEEKDAVEQIFKKYKVKQTDIWGN